ncbi:cold-shock protein [Acidimangrovimonas sediminis]|uniref:cold-shock protein n=1 Tax=Acidimangrovimonas sediminis TaxID=2056283 RepID=UPI000C803EA9|nr:cold shock domain-containing protein [Acidimangrovimonas sediminis]
MTEEGTAPQEVHGRVKWFDPVKGFGFIVADDGGPDILLHANVLRNFGQSSVADGAGIAVRVQQTQRGAQATEVLTIEPPEPVAGQGVLDDLAGDAMPDPADQPLEPARVKWFDKGKGFGFANVFGRSEDVFVHIEVLRMSGFADLQPGEAIGLRIIEGRRGRMATQVTSWEAALREPAHAGSHESSHESSDETSSENSA